MIYTKQTVMCTQQSPVCTDDGFVRNHTAGTEVFSLRALPFSYPAAAKINRRRTFRATPAGSMVYTAKKLRNDLQCLPLSEREVDTHTEIGCCMMHGNILRSHLEELVVRTDEQIETSGMEIQDPAE